jgi:hypothetical protein
MEMPSGNIPEMNCSHCNKRPKLASSASWNGTPPVEGLGSCGRAGGLGKRPGNPFAELETENLKVRAILNDGGGLCWRQWLGRGRSFETGKG